jgi:prolyl-tRNA editing enzyme YbaK/EbsC (Cys-tRNA(Pro) deacylase)
MNQPERRVQAALERAGLDSRVIISAETTHTAEDAARAANCEIGQIVKTLAFDVEGALLLVLIGGDGQVDTAQMAALLAVPRKRIRMLTPEAVLERTGYPVGGVPPLGHEPQPETLVDDALLGYKLVYGAAGSSNAIFPIAPQLLVRATSARIAGLRRQVGGEKATSV